MITRIVYCGEVKHVDELKSGSRGLCPYCRTAKMTVKTSKYGVKYASLMPGEKHSKDTCQTQEKGVVVYEPKKSNSEVLFSEILSRPETEKYDDEENEQEERETDAVLTVEYPEHEITSEQQTEDIAKGELPQKQSPNRRKFIRQDRRINSLKTIWKSSIRSLGYDYPYGTEKLGEIVVFPEFAKRFFANNSGEGKRVFFCRFLGCVDSSQAMIFRLFWKDGERISYRILILRCEAQYEDLYDDFWMKFQECYEDMETHTLKWRAKPNQPDLLIAGDFKWVQEPYCREYCFLSCKDCAVKGALASLLQNEQQVYACPGSGRKPQMKQKPAE